MPYWGATNDPYVATRERYYNPKTDQRLAARKVCKNNDKHDVGHMLLLTPIRRPAEGHTDKKIEKMTVYLSGSTLREAPKRRFFASQTARRSLVSSARINLEQQILALQEPFQIFHENRQRAVHVIGRRARCMRRYYHIRKIP